MSIIKNIFRHEKDDLKTSILQNRGGQQVIERILSAYGFNSRQALCNHLGISQSTMANRYARDTFPADWVVICGIETGVSVEWLAFGTGSMSGGQSSEGTPLPYIKNDLAHNEKVPHLENPIGNFIHPHQGGKAAIDRLVNAYGFRSRQALADHLKISKSTLANRYMRATFPSDWIIQCALETDTSLQWLTTGTGIKSANNRNGVIDIPKKNLVEGTLHNIGHLIMDENFFQQKLKKPLAILQKDKIFIVEQDFAEIQDGKWVVSIDESITIKDIVKVPTNKVRIIDNKTTFDCKVDDLKFVAKVISATSFI
ncbi:TPA: phage repressor protein CI [Klebsiella michiganensis]|nr:phage repressor protein CI [Klebsiella michiganensis]